MRNPKRLLTREDIKENIIAADKRKSVPKITISKYVSELRNSLKVHFKKDVIYSQKDEGWYFDPDKKS
jgi:DNA-binding response OmpR family regulator